jgi:hypothetical protein
MLAGLRDEFGAARLAVQEHLLLFGDEGGDVAPDRSFDSRRYHGNLRSIALSTGGEATRAIPD